jgi:hypothetical protein
MVLSSCFPYIMLYFTIYCLEGMINGDKVEYHPMNKYYQFHIKFWYSYVNSYIMISKEDN